MEKKQWQDNEWCLFIYRPITDDKLTLPDRIRSEVIEAIGKNGVERVEYLLLQYFFSVDRRPGGKAVFKKLERIKKMLGQVEKAVKEIEPAMVEVRKAGIDEDILHRIDSTSFGKLWNSYIEFSLESFKTSEAINSIEVSNTNFKGTFQDYLKMEFLVNLGRAIKIRNNEKLHHPAPGRGGYGQNLLKHMVNILRPFLSENGKKITEDNIKDSIKLI